MVIHYDYISSHDIQTTIQRLNPRERRDYHTYPCFRHDHRNIAKKLDRPLRDGHSEVSNGFQVFFNRDGYATHCRCLGDGGLFDLVSSPHILSSGTAQRLLEEEQDARVQRILRKIWEGRVEVVDEFEVAYIEMVVAEGAFTSGSIYDARVTANLKTKFQEGGVRNQAEIAGADSFRQSRTLGPR
ncbi:MAG: hypothetical protein Q9227_001302 [Pyrenula ochraceoflavens]